MRKHNFNPGPAALPAEALMEGARGVLQLKELGLSVLEISHRSRDFDEILDETEARMRYLMDIPDDYAVLFLHGGARLQFAMVPMNFLPADGKAAYIDTGEWAHKAIEEARLFGQVDVIASSADKQYSYIPKDFTIPEDAAYLHLTSNNTIYGTQWHQFPESPIPVVADMSSDILSRQIDVRKFKLIYAGAQKNAGTAGVTIVIIDKEWAQRVARDLPTMLDYRRHIAARSTLNTPPVFPIYMTMLTLRWLTFEGGLPVIEERNRQKAQLLYEVLDKWPIYEPTANPEDRSLMNVTWRLTKPELEKQLIYACEMADIVGIKGHRKVGGFRASLYNAVSLKSVQVLAEVLDEFGRKYS